MRAKRLPLGLKKTKHNKLVKRLLIIALSLFVVFSQMSLSPFMGKASAEDNVTQTNSQFFDSVKLTTGEGDTAKDVNAENPLKQGDSVNLDYTWTQKDGQKLSADQDVTIQIPSQFKVGTKDAEGKYTTDATGEIKLVDNTTVIGTYTVKASDGATDANKLTIHFDSEKTQNLANASGKLVIPAVFSDEIKADQTTDSIDFDLGNGQKQTVEIPVESIVQDTEKATGADDGSSTTISADQSDSDSSQTESKDGSSQVEEDQNSTTDGSSVSGDQSSSDESTPTDTKSAVSIVDGASDSSTTTKDDSSTSSVNEAEDPIQDVVKNSTSTIQTGNSNIGESAGSESATPVKTVKSFASFSLLSTESPGQEVPYDDPNKNLLTEFKITDQNGNDYDSTNRPGLDSPAHIDMNWEIPDGLTVNVGDKDTFELPNQFAIYNIISGDLKVGDDVVGTYTITPNADYVGKVELVFNDYPSTHNDVKGTISVDTEFNEEMITGSTQQEIKFPIGDSYQNLTIPFKSDNVTAIDKQVEPDQTYNTKTIKWTINVNKKHDALTNAVVTDAIPNGLTLDQSSIKIYKITDVDIKTGEPTVDKNNPVNLSHDGSTNNSLNINLGDTSEAYQIQYSTTVNDLTSTATFTNHATLDSDTTVPITDEASFTRNVGDHLNKAASYDPSDQTITWTINYNGDERNISQGDALIHDLFDNTHELVSGSIEVHHATVNDGGKFVSGDLVKENDSDGYTITPKTASGKNGFDLQFKENVTGAYQIVYKTKPTGLVTKDETVNNTVTADADSTASAHEDIKQHGIIKKNTTTDYAKKTTNWEINVNGDHYQLNSSATITDTLSKGLALDEATLKVRDETTGEDLTQGSDYGYSYDESTGIFTITLNDATNHSLKITYTTKFDATKADKDGDGNPKFSNNSELSWNDEDNEHQSSTQTVPFNPDNYTKANGFKIGNYDATNKTITWKVGLNYNLATINDPIITDTITDDQMFVPNSLKIYKMDLTGGSDGTDIKEENRVLDDNSVYTHTDPSGSNKTLTVNFTGPMTTPYFISYQTSIDGTVIQKDYSNQAIVKDGGSDVTTLTGKVSPLYGGRLVTKDGHQGVETNDEKADHAYWNVAINPSQSTVSDATIVDEPSENQIIIPDTIHIYGTTVASDGTLTKDMGSSLSVNDDYQVNINTDLETGKQTLTVTITNPSPIDRAYILSYETLINANNNDQLTNAVSFSGNHGVVTDEQTSTPVTVKYSKGQATASGSSKGLKIVKTDAEGNKSPIAGATFTLDGTGSLEGLVHREVATDDDGIALFNDLKYGTYTLKETAAPSEYLIDSALKNGKTVTINAGSGNDYTVENVTNKKRIVFHKTDEYDGTPVAGAEYQLQYAPSGEPVSDVGTLTTDENGYFSIDKVLPAGNYQLREIAAPGAYEINSDPIPFAVPADADQYSDQINKSGTDKKVPGSFTLTKVDGENAATQLSGVKFELQYSNGQKVTKDNDGGTSFGSDYEGNGIFHTDENGLLTIENLRPGSYKLVEQNPALGYIKNTKPVKFTIAESIDNITQDDESDTMKNYKTASVTLTKKDGDHTSTVLAGAEYALQMLKNGFDGTNDSDWNTLSTALSTNGSGKISVTGLSIGTYRFVETKAAAGYLLNNKPVTFEILDYYNGDNPSYPNVTAKDYKGSVKLLKEKANGDPLEGATFKVIDKDNGNTEIQSGLTSGSDGVVKAEGLAPGDYAFVETAPASGYILNPEEKPFTIETSASDVPEIKDAGTIKNYQGSATLVKKDKLGNLEGAIFKVIDKDNGDAEVQSGLKSGSNGVVKAEGLAPGHYAFVETDAPTGYITNTEEKIFTIGDSASVEPPAANAGEEMNYRGSAKLLKEKENGDPLGGTTFKVIDKDNGDAEVQSGLTSGSDGVVKAEGLAPGHYAFVETSPASGYILNSEEKPFTIYGTAPEEPSVADAGLLKNYKGSAKLLKEKANGDPLEGATFKVIDKDNENTEIQSGLTSGSDGVVKAEGLAPGDYAFVETAPASGYILNPEEKPFTIETSASDVPEIKDAGTIKNYQGSATLVKKDKLGNLEGATFKVIDKDNGDAEVQSGLKSGSDGVVMAKGLASGHYAFVETDAPTGYIKNTEERPFTISDTATVAPPVANAGEEMNYKGSAKLLKEKANGDPLGGTTFKVIDKDNGDAEVQSGLTSGSDGVVKAEDLAPGHYAFVETNPASGYILNPEEKPFTIYGTAPGEPNVADAGLLKNYKGSAKLLKEKANGDPLEGATFKVIDKDNGNTEIQSGLTSGSDGVVKAEDLAPGHYAFVETNPASGYILNPEEKLFTIYGTAPGEPNVVDAGLLKNYKGSAKLLKEKADGDPLEGATFKVIDKDNGDAEIQSGLTSGSDGVVKAEGLAPGHYAFVETNPALGYILNPEEKSFTIEAFASIEPMAANAGILKNYKGSVQLTKNDENGNGLRDAVFKIIDLHGNLIQDNLKSVEGGVVSATGLAPGEYKFVETQAPEGYIRNLDEFTFQILAETEGVPSTVIIKDPFINYKGSVVLTKYNADKTQVLKGAKFQLQKQDDADKWINQGVAQEATDGTLSVKDLAPGKYQFVETQAPDGYLIHEPVAFTIADENKSNPTAEQVQILDQLNSIVLTKEDKNDPDTKLVGAVYKLVKAGADTIIKKDINDNELPETWTTDKNGQFKVIGLPSGKYEFIETTAPNGYKLDSTRIPFTVTQKMAEAKSFPVTNDLNEAVLTKEDKNDPDAVLKGAEFQLYDENNQLVTKNIKGDKLSETWTTNDQGQFAVRGLPEGDYHFIEMKAPNGYQLDTTPIPLTVTRTGTKAVEITATDKLSEVVLTKVDKNDKDAVLKGAEFKVVDKDGDVVEKDATGKTLPKVWTTDEKGQFTVKGLPNGKYNFIETKAPNGYELDATPIPFKVTNTDVQAQEITATDKINSIVLTKVDKNDPDAVLAGAEFKLYGNNGKVVEKDANGKALPSVWTTNDQGQFTVNGLAPGNYHFIESKAPKNYDLDATPIPFQVTATDVKAIAITAIDLLTPGDVRLTKVDRNDKDAVLKGAVFKLTDSNGKTLKTGLTTDNSGQFIVKDLAPGKYFFIEAKAPKNYALDDTPIPFIIEKGQAKAVEITATDKPLEVTKQLDGKPGAIYNVVDENGHVIVRGVMADEEGNVNFKGLATGKYHLVLVRGVEAETQTTKKPKAKGTKGLPITGDTNDMMTMAAGAILLIGGGFLTIFSRRRRKN